MHLELQFTQNVENGAQRVLDQDSLEVVTQDSKLEVRNLRTSNEPRVWQVALPTIDVEADTTDFDSVFELWGNSSRGSFRGLHTFNFRCFVDDVTYRVRFASPLQVTGPAGHLRHADTFTIRETLETSPTNTVAPAITGTHTVGNVLTVGNGTWTGSPTSYAYQWTRDGVDIATATAATHTLVSGDLAHMIGAYVTATDANGGQTRAWAADVGPIA
jgi:hypothetical protein